MNNTKIHTDNQQFMQYNEARMERENKRICIIACIILACGSLLMYKNSSSMVWGFLLLVAVFVGLYLLSRLAELDNIMANPAPVQEAENEFVMDYDDIGNEVPDNEENRTKFEINMPGFRDEAERAYKGLVKSMNIPDKNLGDYVMDFWTTVDGVYGIIKWDFFKKEIEKFGGRYTKQIIDGDTGRKVKFFEIRIPIEEFYRLGYGENVLQDIIEYNEYLKQNIVENGKKGTRRRTTTRRSTTKSKSTNQQIEDMINMLSDKSKNTNGTKTTKSVPTNSKKENTKNNSEKETSAEIIELLNSMVNKK